MSNQNYVVVPLKNIKISASKIQKFTKGLLGLQLHQAFACIKFFRMKTACIIKQLLHQVGQLLTQHEYNPRLSVIKNVQVNNAPMKHAINIRAKGRFDVLDKRSCHVTFVIQNQNHG